MEAFNNIVSLLQQRPVDTNEIIPGVYFLGVGGIGMSALARYFNSMGIKVSGYDKTETALTKKLVEEGIYIHYEDDTRLLDRQVQLVIYTPALPANHTEMAYYRQHGYTVVKRSEVLGAITKSSFNVCVAGTHGKTTTSTMVAHMLRHSGFGCNAFLGGISVNYNSNFWSDDNNVSVIEADEYDRSFLQLNPDIAIITSADPDHLDIYGTAENMQQAFIDFSKKIKPGGLLVSHYGLIIEDRLEASHHYTYHLSDEKASVHAANIRINNGSYLFDVVFNKDNEQWQLKDVELTMGGLHNIENVLSAISVVHHLGISDIKIKEAVAAFRGVKRRFEYVVKNDATVFVDDYAHHPEELRALIGGAKKLYADKKATVVFQPHLFSRTNDFADGFAEVLDMADEVILLPIYPARELPMEGVDSEMIMQRMKNDKVKVLGKEAMLEYIKENKPSFLITAGAGDIDKLVSPLKEIIEE